ncbi:hypothetical protein KFK09_023012 [Dendrobium nobile]|uniref:Uncharacterized protein n=1 Tax=Dendrobium nobile TaxID=94219 RepID=A0A8T3AKY4_DENNO|nr:hypothetical protein KFK09_023012 [Dendrobium nobile]
MIFQHSVYCLSGAQKEDLHVLVVLIDEQGVPVRHRGRTTCIDIQNMTPSTHVHIEVNENNVPSNISESVLLGSYLGVIARDPVLTPLSFLDWRNKGLEPFKKKMLAEVEDSYPIEEIMESILAGVNATQWCHLVTQWSQPKDKAIKDRLLLWRVNRLHKDDTWSSEDANQRWIQACELFAKDGLTPEDGNVEANERVFSMVMEPEHPCRVRTQGCHSLSYISHIESDQSNITDDNFPTALARFSSKAYSRRSIAFQKIALYRDLFKLRGLHYCVDLCPTRSWLSTPNRGDQTAISTL